MISTQPNLYSGKVKTVEIVDEETVMIHFRDDITAGDGAKRDSLANKGKINCEMTVMIFNHLEKAGIPTHLIKKVDGQKILAKKLQILPVEVVVRNIAAGSFCRRYGIEEGRNFEKPLVEFFLKDDELHDPLISKNAIFALGLATPLEVSVMESMALRVNRVMNDLFSKAGMLLVDFKIEIGKDANGDLYLADELSPDSMRVWEQDTKEKLDKDRFRKDLGNVIESYQTILERLQGIDFVPEPQAFKVKVIINPKKDVPNPAGEVVKRSLVNFGIEGLASVSVGKTISTTFETELAEPKWQEKIRKAAHEFLSNPLIEDFSIEVFEE